MDNYAHFTSIGRIVYDPKRPGMRSRVRASGSNTIDWWCILEVDREIARYYRWWIGRHWWGRTALRPDWLCPPAWNPHVSVCRGEVPRPQDREHWRAYHGEKVEFQYAHYPRQTTQEDRTRRYTKDGDFWFLDVVCPRIDEIRHELGLRTHYRYHMTVGRTFDAR
jgi:hypothetical protein